MLERQTILKNMWPEDQKQALSPRGQWKKGLSSGTSLRGSFISFAHTAAQMKVAGKHWLQAFVNHWNRAAEIDVSIRRAKSDCIQKMVIPHGLFR